MNFDSDQAAITPISQSYLKIDSTGALWIPTGTNGQRPGSPNAGFIRYNTDTPGLEHWNGATWAAIGGSSGSGSVDTVEVAWFFTDRQCRFALNESTMVIDLTSEMFDVTQVAGTPAFASGQTVFVLPYTDKTKTGIYTLGSVASLSAVTLTRHTDWPSSKAIPRGTQVYVNYYPESWHYRELIYAGSPDNVQSASFNATTNTVFGSNYTTADVGKLISIRNLNSGATLPGGLSIDTIYQLESVTTTGGSNRYTLSSTVGGSAIDLTSTGTNGSGGYIAELVPVDGPFRNLSGVLELLGPWSSTYNSGDDTWTWADLSVTTGYPLAIRASTFVPYNTTDVAFSSNAGGAVLGGKAEDAKSIAIGGYVPRTGIGDGSIAIGINSYAKTGIALGAGSNSIEGTAIGSSSYASTSSIAIGTGSSAPGLYSTAINGSTFAIASVAIGTGSYTSNENQFYLSRGFLSFDGGFDVSKVVSLAYSYQGKTTNGTELELDVNYGQSGDVGLKIFSGNYFATGEIVARLADGSKFAVWDIDGIITSTFNVGAYDLTFDLRFIPSANSGHSEALALKVRAATVTPGAFNSIGFFVTGAASATYYWQVDLRLSGYDVSSGTANPFSLSSAKKTVSSYVWLPASETINAGAPVNIWNDTGTVKVRNANASNGRQADGFAAMTYTTGDMMAVMLSGDNQLVSGLTIGPVYLGTSSGTYTSTPPAASNLCQTLGFAVSSSRFAFVRETPIQQ